MQNFQLAKPCNARAIDYDNYIYDVKNKQQQQQQELQKCLCICLHRTYSQNSKQKREQERRTTAKLIVYRKFEFKSYIVHVAFGSSMKTKLKFLSKICAEDKENEQKHIQSDTEANCELK